MASEPGANDMMRPLTPLDGFVQTWASIWSAWQVKAGVGTIIASFCSLFGMDERIFTMLCIAVFADFLCGVGEALKRHRFRCRAVYFGMTKVFWLIVYIGIVGLINQSLSIALDYRLSLLNLFVSYLIASDCISITGHLQGMGVKIPPLLIYIVNFASKLTKKKVEEVLEPDKHKDPATQLGQDPQQPQSQQGNGGKTAEDEED